MIDKTFTYILINKIIVPCPDIDKWIKWIRDIDNKRVAFTVFNDVEISTIFLGMNHSVDENIPILFETLVFGGQADGYCKRYTNWVEAELGHWETVLHVLDNDETFLKYIEGETEEYTEVMANIDDELIKRVIIDEI